MIFFITKFHYSASILRQENSVSFFYGNRNKLSISIMDSCTHSNDFPRVQLKLQSICRS
uniref:Uncharacterized protein n=1 Tax=Rhizophora mucronata TaxID=61149 RepID=A0A2P2INQ6_RHIMU